MERPLELRVKTPSGRWLLLSVSINDSVLGVRQLLSELPIVCRWTNYTLQLCSRTAGSRPNVNDVLVRELRVAAEAHNLAWQVVAEPV